MHACIESQLAGNIRGAPIAPVAGYELRYERQMALSVSYVWLC